MALRLCSRCKQRPAVVFITKVEGNKSTNEGLCLPCAKELGIKPVNDIMEKMGISDEDLNAMSEELQGLLPFSDDNGDDSNEGRAPSVNLGNIFQNFPRDHAPGAQQNEQAAQGDKKTKPKRKFLEQFCINLTKKAAEGRIDKIVGREHELQRMMQILCRRQKNNPCLIGEPGVGKTAIAEALALKISEKNVPYKLADKEIYLVDMTAIVAGTQFRGQFENRLKGLIDEAKALGNIILVIDEVHSIVSAGDAEGGMNAANILKPALSRGEIQIIGATTLVEYRKYIEKDSALERRFQPIIINEPSIEDTVKILSGIKGYYEQYHGIKIPDHIVRAIVTLSERYITDRYLPDKAIDLMDEASSFMAMNSPCINELNEVSDELNKLVSEREAIESGEQDEESYKKLADLKTAEMQLRTRFDELSAKRDGLALSENDLAGVIEVWTGIPAANITENEFNKIDRLEAEIKKRIIGQDKAVEQVAKAIKRSRAGISYKKKPVSFIFAGSTGVGKTELVKVLANYMFDTPDSLIRLDMSEFMEKHSVSRIIGSPPGYVGYDDAGQLTEKIRRKPYSIILFDEIEKAHPDVLNILLQILDDGKLTDAHGKEVNFENTVIIMTTNAGSNSESLAGFSANTRDQDSEKVKKALESFLRPEFLNRVDEVIVFNKLTRENFGAICEIMLNDLKDVLSLKGIAFAWDKGTVSYLADKGFSEKFGARNLRRLIQTEIEDAVASKIISNYSAPFSIVSVNCKKGKLTIDCR